MKTGRVCASVSGNTASDVMEKIFEAEKTADLIEVRFDHLPDNELTRLLDQLRVNGCKKPLIATYRSSAQGGRAPRDPASRKHVCERLGSGFWAVDQEEDIFERADGRQYHILSYHDFDSGSGDAMEVFERLRSKNPTVVKYAYLAGDITDTIPVWKMLKFAEDVSQPAVIIAMGEAGKITRILGPAYGSQWTYGSVADGTAPGQISVNDLIDLYRVPTLSRDTKVYGVIGDPVSQSLSPRIQNAAFKDAAIDSVFLPLLVKDLRGFIERMVRLPSREVDLNFAGFAVTMPHKLSIMQFLDEIDETARMIGAVNTVRVEGDSLKGYNTDAEGFITPLLKMFGSLKEARVAVLGAGGAARACLYALKVEGASLAIFARDPGKGASLAEAFGAESHEMNGAALGEFDIVVNATSIGMTGTAPDDLYVDFAPLHRIKVVYDLVTSAEPTPLVRVARAAGIKTITGVEMLIAQAAMQFEIWTGVDAPTSVMHQAVKAFTSRG